MIDIENVYKQKARQWLDENAKLRTTNNDGKREFIWGQGEFSVAVFHNLSFEEEKAIITDAMKWTQRKAEVGYHKITWEPEFGGMGLTKETRKGIFKT